MTIRNFHDQKGQLLAKDLESLIWLQRTDLLLFGERNGGSPTGTEPDRPPSGPEVALSNKRSLHIGGGNCQQSVGEPRKRDYKELTVTVVVNSHDARLLVK